MQAVKIVVTGSFAAGKTAFIRAVSDIEVVATECDVTERDERRLKAETTVALDFGTLAIDDNVSLYLFGTPGQERFDFMWDVLAIGCIGYIVLVDSCRPGGLTPTRRIIDHFAGLTDVPFVVAANKQDDPAALPPAFIHRRLGLPQDVPVVPCIATERESVKQVLLTLLNKLEP